MPGRLAPLKHHLAEGLKLDESCISNPKSEVFHWTGCVTAVAVQFAISAFGFEMQDSSNFKFPRPVTYRKPTVSVWR